MTKPLARPLLSSLLSLSVLVVLLLDPAAAVATSTEQIPSPRPSGWTVDLTGTLPAETIADLNRLGDEVKAQTGGEMAVVVIGSTDGANARDFASQLFNQWGIGDAQTNRGILVFAALDDHSAEIILGRGLEGPEYVQVSEGIMQGDMVPRFRSGDAPGAVFQGALSCAQQLFGATPTIVQATPLPPLPAPVAPLAAPEASRYPAPAAYQPVGPDSSVDVGRLVALGAVLLLLFSFALPSYLRYRPRRCSRCTTKMVRLDEEKDDAHLAEQERMEEQIGSVDYDVWACPSCAQTLKLRHDRIGSGYSQCPDCGAKTVSETSNTLVQATYDHGGQVRVDERCVHCSYHSSSTHSTPQLYRHDDDDNGRHSSSTSSSFSSSSSSSHSSSSSSSSSSGGSFGGGSSSGSGASGRW
jgi:uncharacterized protein